MPLDHSLVGVPSEPQERSWTSKDALLYAIGVGAGLGDPLAELEFTTENSEGVNQQVLPTYAVLVAQARASRSLGDFDRALLVHAEQAFELHRPLPVEGTVRTVATVTGIYDKGSGALVASENVAVDAATGAKLVTSRSGAFIRGEGGFGGERGPSDGWQRPERPPDHRVGCTTWWSGGRSGRCQRSLGPRSPPNPPSPLMNAPLREVTSLAPVAASTAVFSLATSAPEPLS